MSRTLSLNSPQTRILAAMDTKPGEFLAVDTLAQLASLTDEKARVCLPGHISHMHDRLLIERARVPNPVSGGRTTVWGYRRTQEQTAAAEAAPVPRKALQLDPAAWALANPPRGVVQRVASLDNQTYYMGKVAAPPAPRSA